MALTPYIRPLKKNPSDPNGGIYSLRNSGIEREQQYNALANKADMLNRTAPSVQGTTTRPGMMLDRSSQLPGLRNALQNRTLEVASFMREGDNQNWARNLEERKLNQEQQKIDETSALGWANLDVKPLDIQRKAWNDALDYQAQQDSLGVRRSLGEGKLGIDQQRADTYGQSVTNTDQNAKANLDLKQREFNHKTWLADAKNRNSPLWAMIYNKQQKASAETDPDKKKLLFDDIDNDIKKVPVNQYGSQPAPAATDTGATTSAIPPLPGQTSGTPAPQPTLTPTPNQTTGAAQDTTVKPLPGATSANAPSVTLASETPRFAWTTTDETEAPDLSGQMHSRYLNWAKQYNPKYGVNAAGDYLNERGIAPVAPYLYRDDANPKQDASTRNTADLAYGFAVQGAGSPATGQRPAYWSAGVDWNDEIKALSPSPANMDATTGAGDLPLADPSPDRRRAWGMNVPDQIVNRDAEVAADAQNLANVMTWAKQYNGPSIANGYTDAQMDQTGGMDNNYRPRPLYSSSKASMDRMNAAPSMPAEGAGTSAETGYSLDRDQRERQVAGLQGYMDNPLSSYPETEPKPLTVAVAPETAVNPLPKEKTRAEWTDEQGRNPLLAMPGSDNSSLPWLTEQGSGQTFPRLVEIGPPNTNPRPEELDALNQIKSNPKYAGLDDQTILALIRKHTS